MKTMIVSLKIFIYISSYLVMPSISSQATNLLHDQYFHKPNCKSAVYICYSTFLANIFLHKMSQKIQTQPNPPYYFFRHFVSNFLAPRNVYAPYIKQLIILLTSQFVPSSPGAGTQYYLIVNLQKIEIKYCKQSKQSELNNHLSNNLTKVCERQQSTIIPVWSKQRLNNHQGQSVMIYQ